MKRQSSLTQYRYCIMDKRSRLFGNLSLLLIGFLFWLAFISAVYMIYDTLKHGISAYIVATFCIISITLYLSRAFSHTWSYFKRAFCIVPIGIYIRTGKRTVFYLWDQISEIAFAVIATDAGHNYKTHGLVIVLQGYDFDYFSNRLSYGTMEYTRISKSVIVIDKYEDVLKQLKHMCPLKIVMRP